MRLLEKMKSSIHRRYIAILTLTIVATGFVACIIAFQLLRKVAELANDEKVVQSLSDSIAERVSTEDFALKVQFRWI